MDVVSLVARLVVICATARASGTPVQALIWYIYQVRHAIPQSYRRAKTETHMMLPYAKSGRGIDFLATECIQRVVKVPTLLQNIGQHSMVSEDSTGRGKCQ